MKIMATTALLLLSIHFSNAQSIQRQLIASGGDYEIADGLSLSFTIGELAVVPQETNNLLLYPGFQQGESAQTTSIPNPGWIRFSVFPNPTTGQVQVRWDEKQKTSLKISTLDVNGRILQQQIFSEASPGMELNLGKWASGSYFILIENNYGEKGSISIIKRD